MAVVADRFGSPAKVFCYCLNWKHAKVGFDIPMFFGREWPHETKKTKIVTKKRRPIQSGTRLWESETAVYAVLAAARDSVVVEGVGDHIGNDGKNPIRVRAVAKVRQFSTTVVN